jgi:hypothetical protein
MLGIIDLVGRSEVVQDVADSAARLASSKTYFTLLGCDRVTWRDILMAGLSLNDKARVAAIRKAPALAARVSRRRALRRADR